MNAPKIPTDKYLVKSYISGKEESLKILIERHKDDVFTYIYYIVNDRYIAEDIFQDTFIKVINTLRKGNYREEGKFVKWVIKIAHNLIVDYFRKISKIPILNTADGVDVFSFISINENNIESEIIEKETSINLGKLILKLPKEQREVVILKYFSNLSFKEIAQLTGVSINTSLGRMRYAINKLRKMIEQNKITI